MLKGGPVRGGRKGQREITVLLRFGAAKGVTQGAPPTTRGPSVPLPVAGGIPPPTTKGTQGGGLPQGVGGEFVGSGAPRPHLPCSPGPYFRVGLVPRRPTVRTSTHFKIFHNADPSNITFPCFLNKPF